MLVRGGRPIYVASQRLQLISSRLTCLLAAPTRPAYAGLGVLVPCVVLPAMQVGYFLALLRGRDPARRLLLFTPRVAPRLCLADMAKTRKVAALRTLDDPQAFGHTEVRVKVRDVIAALEGDGWQLVRTRGSHRQFRHSSKPGTVTVAGKPSVDVPVGTLASIWKQAGIKKP